MGCSKAASRGLGATGAAISLIFSLILLAVVNSAPNMPRNNNNMGNPNFGWSQDFDRNSNSYNNYEDPSSASNTNIGTDFSGRDHFNNHNSGNNNQPPSFRRQPPTGGRPSGSRHYGGGLPGISSQPSKMAENFRPKSSHFSGYVAPSVTEDDNVTTNDINIGSAFAGCQTHKDLYDMASLPMTDGQYSTKPQPMKHGSTMALYSHDLTHPITVNIRMPNLQYKAKLDRTSLSLNHCDISGESCEEEDSFTFKNQLMVPGTWNYIDATLDHGRIVIKAGVGTVKSNNALPREQLEEAEWIVSNDKQHNVIVQYPCAEYIAKHPPPTPSPLPATTPSYNPPPRDDGSFTYGDSPYSPPPQHVTLSPRHDSQMHGNNTSTETSPGNSTATIVIIVIVAVALVALLVAIAVSQIRKKRTNQSSKPTENTPLDKASENMQQSQSQQQCETHAHEQQVRDD